MARLREEAKRGRCLTERKKRASDFVALSVHKKEELDPCASFPLPYLASFRCSPFLGFASLVFPFLHVVVLSVVFFLSRYYALQFNAYRDIVDVRRLPMPPLPKAEYFVVPLPSMPEMPCKKGRTETATLDPEAEKREKARSKKRLKRQRKREKEAAITTGAKGSASAGKIREEEEEAGGEVAEEEADEEVRVRAGGEEREDEDKSGEENEENQDEADERAARATLGFECQEEEGRAEENEEDKEALVCGDQTGVVGGVEADQKEQGGGEGGGGEEGEEGGSAGDVNPRSVDWLYRRRFLAIQDPFEAHRTLGRFRCIRISPSWGDAG